ncbi:hypothetical protein HanRHA438_Chr07g0326801 [Helianthus annuus]|nr:hypothetical protein HanRHA438_Chr07g0326801 [Helianthus annuus]
MVVHNSLLLPQNPSFKCIPLFVFEFLQHQADTWQLQQGSLQQNPQRNLHQERSLHWLPHPPNSVAFFLLAQELTNILQKKVHHETAVPRDLSKVSGNFALH